MKRADDGDRSSVDRVYEALREKILSGAYPPGSRLILSRLANEHQMSFIPVREALQRLEGERMVRSERNRGWFVNPLRGGLGRFLELFSTHPPIEERVRRLRALRFT